MNHYPIAISDTGALPDRSFIGDTLSSPLGIGLAAATIGGGYLIGGKKHHLIGAAIGVGALYAIWLRGRTLTGV